MYSICCTLPKPDYKAELTPEEFKAFCALVHQYRNQKYLLPDAQAKAYSQVLSESIPFKV